MSNLALVANVDQLDALAATDHDFLHLSELILNYGKADLATVQNIETIADARAKVLAAGQYISRAIKSRELKLEAQNNIAEIRLRQERYIGQLLKELPKNEGAKGSGSNQHEVRLHDDTAPKLTDVGVSKSQSSRWQTMAELPADEFEDAILDAKENTWELTSYDILSRAKEHKRKLKRESIQEAAQVVIETTFGIIKQPRYTVGSMVAIGGHILVCNDNTSVQVKELLSARDKAALVFCDPPYNAGVGEWDAGEFIWQQDYLADHAEILAVTPGIGNIPNFMRQTSMPYKWSTSTHISNGMTRGALGFGNWIYTALFSHDKSIHRNAQDAYTVTINALDGDDLGAKRQKPPMYLSWLFDLFTTPGDLIIDAFGGSGTSVIVANNMQRHCLCIEKDPDTFSQMVARIEAAINLKPFHQEAA